MEAVAQGAVIKNHDLAEIGLDLGEVLDVSPIANSAVLPVVSSREVLALHLQPVDDRVGILLDRSGEYDQVVPLTDLVATLVTCWRGRLSWAPHLLQKVITVRPLMNIVQEWDLGSDDLPTRADGCLQLYLYHVASLEATAIDYAVDQCLIEIDD